MIETTSVDDAGSGFSAAPASRNDCGLTSITSAAILPISLAEGLGRQASLASALIWGEGEGSFATTRFASSPCSSQPVSIAPPILPAPASTMVPLMFCSPLVLFNEVTTNTVVVPAKAGTHNHQS